MAGSIRLYGVAAKRRDSWAGIQNNTDLEQETTEGVHMC